MKNEWVISPQALSRARARSAPQPGAAREEVRHLGSVRLASYERSTQRDAAWRPFKVLAKALTVDVRDIAASRGKATTSSAPPGPPSRQATAPATTSALPPRTQLETMIDLERAGRDRLVARRRTPRGVTETLTAKRLQDVFTAYALHEGARFCLTGLVDTSRGIAPAEATLVGGRNGVAARFHILKEVAPGRPMGVTIHTERAEHTRELLKHHGAEVTVYLRVFVVPGDSEGRLPKRFSSFITRITAKRPWTFVVEDVVEGDAGKAAPKRRRHARGRSERIARTVTKPEERKEEPSTRTRGQRRDLLAALASGFVGALALATSTYNVYLQRQQVRAEVWPRLVLRADYSVAVGEDAPGDDFDISVVNRGVGPANVKRVRVTVDGERAKTWLEAEAMLLRAHDLKESYSIQPIENEVLSPGLEIMTFKIRQHAREIVAERRRLGTEICYCSTLDECWLLRSSDPCRGRRARSRSPGCEPDAVPFHSIGGELLEHLNAGAPADAGSGRRSSRDGG